MINEIRFWFEIDSFLIRFKKCLVFISNLGKDSALLDTTRDVLSLSVFFSEASVPVSDPLGLMIKYRSVGDRIDFLNKGRDTAYSSYRSQLVPQSPIVLRRNFPHLSHPLVSLLAFSLS